MGMGIGRSLRGAAIAMTVATLAGMATTGARAEAEATPVQNAAPAAAAPHSFTVKVDIPKVEAVNSSVDEDTLKKIFSGDVASNADALAHLNADSIKIPQMTVTMSGIEGANGKDATVTAHYADIDLEKVVDGVAASVSVGSIDSGNTEAQIVVNTATASDFDIGAALAFAGLVKSDNPEQMKTIYKDFRQSGMTLKTKGADCSVAGISLAEVRARPLKMSFGDVAALVQANKESDKPSPEVVAKLVAFIADASSAVEISPGEADGIKCDTTDDSGKPVNIGIDKIEVGAFSGPKYPQIGVDNLSIAASDGSVSLTSLILKPIDYSRPIATIQGAGGNLNDEWFQAHGRELIPDFGGFTLKDAKVDVPDSASPDMRVKGSIASLDLTMADYVNGVPTSLSSSAEHMVVDLPQDSTDSNVQQLQALGITQLDLGYELAMSWDQQRQTIRVDKFGMSGSNLGSLMLAAVLGNATKELFGNDTDAAKAAAMNLTVKSLGLDAVDEGVGDLIFKQLAADAGTTPEAERTAISGMAQGMSLAILGGTADTMGFASAIGTFLNGGHSLSAKITAKQDGGLPLKSLETLTGNPTALAGKFSVEATAK